MKAGVNMRKFLKSILLIVPILAMTGCAFASATSIDIIEQDRIAKETERKEKEEERRRLIAEEKERQEKEEREAIKKEVKESVKGILIDLEDGKPILAELKDTEEKDRINFYRNILSKAEVKDVEVGENEDRAIASVSMDYFKDYKTLISNIKSPEFENAERAERQKQHIWDQAGIESLHDDLIAKAFAQASKIKEECTIEMYYENGEWLLKSITRTKTGEDLLPPKEYEGLEQEISRN